MPTSNLQHLLATVSTLLNEQRFEEARQLLTTVYSEVPDNPEIAYSLGNTCRRLHDYPAAVSYYCKATALRPGFFAAWCNGGAALREMGKFSEALAMLEKAVALQPESVEALANLAMVLCDCKRQGEAIPYFERVLLLKPEMSSVAVQLADCFLSVDAIDKAKNILEHSDVAPSAELFCARGRCALAERNLPYAKECFYNAAALSPACGEAHFQLGNIMREWNHIDEALQCYKKALELLPERIDVLVNSGEAFQLAGAIEASIQLFKKVLSLDPHCRLAQHNLLVSLNYSADHPAKEIYEAHRAWGKEVHTSNIQTHHDTTPERRLRIGYLSPDFCNHPAAAFLEPMLRYRNHDAFELFCYAQTVHTDERTAVFRSLTDHWHTVEHLNDDALCSLIVNDRIDILVDTAGHFGGNRLEVLARRPAPLQVSGIGYPGPTGLPAIRYRITDAVIDPPDNEWLPPHEQLIVLDNGFCCYTPPLLLPPVNAPADRPITFGSLHTTARLNSATINLWSRVLAAIPDARLIICRNTLSPSIIKRLSGWFEEQGVALARIHFITTIGSAGHLVIYHDIDVTLDTLPWSGHTTACESLIMGVPVITLTGTRPAGRMVSSVLTAAGLSECVAATPDEFVVIACKYASDRAARASLRLSLRDRIVASPLCDGRSYMHELEEKYRICWREWCRAQ